jgi:hypothetical protein
MAAKDALAGGNTPKKPQGSGTKVSGYVESPVPKKCGTCVYLHNGSLCVQKTVLKDTEVPFARRSKFKKVDAETGCCDFWQPESK